KRNSISIGNLNFLPLICYEIIFSGKLNPDKENFSFIINISEDAWFGNTIGPYQHLAHAVFRAVEEGKFIYRSTNKGISAIVNDKGQILYKIPLSKEGFIESKLLLGSKNTFFSKYNNNIFYFILLLNVIFLIFFFNKKNYKI
ncbi:MAG: nitrilase-related carbon-nitrogen hydrolase, partial [Candidatus Fonsibacter sp.]